MAKKRKTRITWDQFKARCLAEHLCFNSFRSIETTVSAWKHLERVLMPRYLDEVGSSELSRLFAELREGRSLETLRKILGHLRATFRWAVRVGLLEKEPEYKLPRRKKRILMRGRPFNLERLQLFTDSINDVRPDDYFDWFRLSQVLWLSGLRLGEAMDLSWEPTPEKPNIDLESGVPLIYFPPGSQKSGHEELMPTAPDFGKWIAAVPKEDRKGLVCPVSADVDRAKRIISEIGELDDPQVTAHDFRRSFGTRWSSKVKTTVLQRLMRHADIKTTIGYYVLLDPAEITRSMMEEAEQESEKPLTREDALDLTRELKALRDEIDELRKK